MHTTMQYRVKASLALLLSLASTECSAIWLDEPSLYNNNGTFDVPLDIRLPTIEHHINVAGSSGVVISENYILVASHVASPANGWPGTPGGPSFPDNRLTIFRDHNGVRYEQDSQVYDINYLYPGATADLSIVKVRPLANPIATAAFSPDLIASVTSRFVGDNTESVAVHGNSASTNAPPRVSPQGHRSWFFKSEDHRVHGNGTTLSQGGDSGGGNYIPRGWEWDLVGFSSNGGGYNGLNEAAIAGIEDIIGLSLKRASTARPNETKFWTGSSGSSWGSAASWQSGTAPQYTAEQSGLSFGNRVGDIISLPANRRVVIDSVARALQLFSDGSAGSQLQIVSGADVFTDQLYTGAEDGDIGLIEISGGTVTTGDFYSGFRGQGLVLQSGGEVVSNRVIVGGEDNGSLNQSYYGMLGTASVSTQPTLDTDVLLIAPENDSKGRFQMFFSPHAELTTRRSYVGGAGVGQFDQSVGVHSTKYLSIAAGSKYVLSGGELSISPQGTLISLGHLSLTGGTLSYDPDELSELRLEGVIEFGSVPHTLEFAGVHKMDNLSLINATNGTFSMADQEGLLLVSPTIANSGVSFQSAGQPEHTIGSGHVVLDTHTLAVLGNEITDPIELSGNGTLKVGSLSSPLHWLDGGSVVGGLQLQVVEGRYGGTPSLLMSDQIMNTSAVNVRPNGKLIAEGVVAAVTFIMDGAVEVGTGVSSLSIQGNLFNTRVEGELSIDATSSGSDQLTATSATLGGELRVVVPSEAADLDGSLDIIIGQEFDIITTSSGLSGRFEKVKAVFAEDSSVELSGSVFNLDSIHDKDGKDFSLVALYDEIAHMVTLRAALPGDFNFDNIVDGLDLDILGSGAVPRDGGWSDGDANQDGRVDLLDMDLLSNYFNASYSPGGSSVPEPSTFLLSLIGLFVLERFRGLVA